MSMLKGELLLTPELLLIKELQKENGNLRDRLARATTFLELIDIEPSILANSTFKNKLSDDIAYLIEF